MAIVFIKKVFILFLSFDCNSQKGSWAPAGTSCSSLEDQTSCLLVGLYCSNLQFQFHSLSWKRLIHTDLIWNSSIFANCGTDEVCLFSIWILITCSFIHWYYTSPGVCNSFYFGHKGWRYVSWIKRITMAQFLISWS